MQILLQPEQTTDKSTFRKKGLRGRHEVCPVFAMPLPAAEADKEIRLYVRMQCILKIKLPSLPKL
jgi:hypothetical protein